MPKKKQQHPPTNRRPFVRGPSMTQIPATARDIANPYMPGTSKFECFEIFRNGGPRDEVKRKMLRIGITSGTVDTWLSRFRAHVREAS